MGEPARLGTAAAQPATSPTTSSRIDAATAARAAARMGTLAGPAATSAVAVGRATAAAAPPWPPLVPQGADRHPGGGSGGTGVAVRPGGVGRRATDSTCQPCCPSGSLHEHRPGLDGGSHHRRPGNHDSTGDGSASDDPTAHDGPGGCDDAAADDVGSATSNYGRTVAVRSAGQPVRLQLLRARRAHHQSGARRLRLLRLHRQLRERDWLHGGVPRRQVQHVRRSAGRLFLPPGRLAACLRRLSRTPHRYRRAIQHLPRGVRLRRCCRSGSSRASRLAGARRRRRRCRPPGHRTPPSRVWQGSSGVWAAGRWSW
jgi:hypothetical protein